MLKNLQCLLVLAVIPSTLSIVDLFIAPILPFYTYLRVYANDKYGNEIQHKILLEQNENIGRLQVQLSNSTPFLCDVDGPGRRSPIPPTSVDDLRPGDIDIVAAIGDSITSGSAILARNITSILVENKGLAFNIGGDGSWRNFLTLPNILREFNPKLYGYSYGNGPSFARNAMFNMAEPITKSDDLMQQTKLMYERMKADSNVDMKKHWKLVSIFMGSNDICSRMCFNDYAGFVNAHKGHVQDALRFIRDNMPRTLVSYMPLVNLKEAYGRKLPFTCTALNTVYCPCFIELTDEIPLFSRNRYSQYMEKWVDAEYEVINRPEFHTKEDFDVVIQPFLSTIKLPRLEDGTIDPKYLAFDCFHFSQKGQASLANMLWNNLLQPEGEKQLNWSNPFTSFECPTDQRPYIATTRNSQK